MTYKQFRELVHLMRTLQRVYLKTRSPGVLHECENAEREVDAVLESKLEDEQCGNAKSSDE